MRLFSVVAAVDAKHHGRGNAILYLSGNSSLASTIE